MGDTVGGSHVSSLTLVGQLAKSEEVEPIVALEREGKLSEHLERRGLPFKFFPHPIGGLHHGLKSGLLPALLSAPRLAAWLRAERFEIVHTNDFRMHVLWSVASRLAGVKHVLHLRSPQRASLGFRLLANSATQVVTVTDYCRHLLGPALSKRVLVVPNPVEPVQSARSRERARGQLFGKTRIPKTSFTVGWSGNFLDRKRPEDFIRLAINLPEPILTRTSFLMFGDHSSSAGDRVKALITQHSLEDKVRLVGWDDDFPELVGGLDLLIATSEEESFGRTLVEAIIAGTPVIASDIGAHSEVLREGRYGQLFPTGNVEKLVSLAAKHLQDMSSGIKLTLEGSSFLTNFHSPASHSERLIAVYRWILQ